MTAHRSICILFIVLIYDYVYDLYNVKIIHIKWGEQGEFQGDVELHVVTEYLTQEASLFSLLNKKKKNISSFEVENMSMLI